MSRIRRRSRWRCRITIHPSGTGTFGSGGWRATISWTRLLDGRFLDEIETREILLQVSVSLALNQILPGAIAVRIAFPIAAIKLVHHFHPADYFPERRESGTIETRIIHQVDEHLRGARSGARHGKAD